MSETVFVIAPHPDDEAIGCGGMICLHRKQKDKVHIIFLTSGEKGIPNLPEDKVRSIREAEAAKAGKVLGVNGLQFLRLGDQELHRHNECGIGELLRQMETQRPNIIYLPHPDDDHPDHQVVFPMVCSARARLNKKLKKPELRGFEVWSPMSRYGWVEDISAVMPRKLRAIRCYRSQLKIFRYDRAVQGLNQYRGALGGCCANAEAFVYLDPMRPERS
jgi:N-acetylglucosamine malate deacetylase 1